MERKSKRRRRVGSSSHRPRNRRRSNPGFGFGRVKHRARRRRRNPGGFGGFGVRDLTGTILWGTAGALSARVIPSTFLKDKNTGLMGYAANGAVAVFGGMLVSKFLRPQAGQEFTAGGLIALGLRLFEDWMGNGATQMNGDLGYYIENSFPVPTTGSGPFLLNAGYSGSPMQSVQAAAQVAALPAAVAPVGGDEPTRWNSRWAA